MMLNKQYSNKNEVTTKVTTNKKGLGEKHLSL
jgi:hypothetical protein